MKVTNLTQFSVIAFCFDTDIGYGKDVLIEPGSTKDVEGPPIGDMGGKACYMPVEGAITCHEKEDDDNGFQVKQGCPLSLQGETQGITVRHHLDDAEAHVIAWRNSY